LKIAVGEKAVGDSVDQKPGGSVIYQSFNFPLTEGTHDYALKIPRFVAEYPNSQNLPAEIPEVLPFRYCEITSPSGKIKINHKMLTYNSVVNAFYCRALFLMGKMAKVIHNEADAEFFDKKAQKVKEIFNATFLDQKRGVYIDGIGTDHSSIQSNMFPLVFGLVPEAFEKQVTWYIKSKGMACSVYGANYLLEGLYDAGEGQYALGLLTSETDRSWINMLRMGSTITTEAWDLKYEPDLISWTHAWSASPARIIPGKLMGIEPEEAGFGKIRIKLQPGDLAKAAMKIPTIRGEIDANFKQNPGEFFDLKITIPVNTTARVLLPQIADKYILTIDGKNIPGAKEESSRIVIDGVESGSHTFRIQKTK
jgi:alpha-L-rhamnosidase